jgi:preprotein translocase subunit SecG
VTVGKIVSSALLLIVAVLIIIIVLLQEGHQSNISGAIGGGADTFLGKNKGRSIDAFLSRCTKIIAIAFFVLTLVCNVFTIGNF